MTLIDSTTGEPLAGLISGSLVRALRKQEELFDGRTVPPLRARYQDRVWYEASGDPQPEDRDVILEE